MGMLDEASRSTDPTQGSPGYCTPCYCSGCCFSGGFSRQSRLTRLQLPLATFPGSFSLGPLINTSECRPARFHSGILYNYGGLPFIGDPQAAVFYPPRWITIGLSSLLGDWNYNSLQMEMTFHVLLYTILMYAFVRRLTLQQTHSRLAAFAAAVIIGYGGYTTGYSPAAIGGSGSGRVAAT